MLSGRARSHGSRQAGPIPDFWINVTDSQTDAASLVFNFEKAQLRIPGVSCTFVFRIHLFQTVWKYFRYPLTNLRFHDSSDKWVLQNHKKLINGPPKRRSVYNTWKPIDRHDLLKFLAVLIAVGLKKRVANQGLLDQVPTPVWEPWYQSKMFPEKRGLKQSTRQCFMHPILMHSRRTKLNPFWADFLKSFRRHIYIISECIVESHGDWVERTLEIPPSRMISKPRKYHIKTFGQNVGHFYRVCSTTFLRTLVVTRRTIQYLHCLHWSSRFNSVWVFAEASR